MVPTERPRKRGKGRACKRCHDSKTKCIGLEDSPCVNCIETNVACSLSSSSLLPTNGKRKNEEPENISDRLEFIQSTRATSSATVSYDQLDTLINRNVNPQPKSPKPSRPSAQKKRGTTSWFCGICQQDYKADMLECEIQTCKVWCHVLCIYNFGDRRHMLFSSPTIEKCWFICPKCLDQPNESVCHLVAECARTTEALRIRVSSGEGQSHEQGIPKDFSSQTIEDQQENLLPEHENFYSRTQIVSDFEPAREEKFQGLDNDEVVDLIYKLDQFIYDYNKEVMETIERFGDGDDAWINRPLAQWNLIDAGQRFVEGQPWYLLDYPAKIPTINHLPITAALRRMLDISGDKALEISPNLDSLSFSQVHTAFVGWFVIDVLRNKLDIYGLPSMKPMRAMMAAVKEFADARWPGKGQYALREVHLRTWYKRQFQKAMLQDEGNLMRRMEAYLEPLTKKFQNISRWSHTGANIIEDTLKLWSYLESLRGTFIRTHTRIGDVFIPRLHEPYDEKGEKLYPDKHVEKKILWVLRPGFQVIEDGSDGPRQLNVKARVVLE